MLKFNLGATVKYKGKDVTIVASDNNDKIKDNWDYIVHDGEHSYRVMEDELE